MKHVKFVRPVKEQISQSLLLAVFISLSGGLQDAYTYFCRGKVFANAQTGNFVFLSVNVVTGQWLKCLNYLVPLLAFFLGTIVAALLHRKLKEKKLFHWRQPVLICEILILFAVGFLPQSLNMLANALVSFVCAMQVHSFQKIEGNTFASTMCIGNISRGAESIYRFITTHEKRLLKRALIYFIVIVVFACGAGLGYFLTTVFADKAIWFSCLFLLIAFVLMFIRPQEERKTESVSYEEKIGKTETERKNEIETAGAEDKTAEIESAEENE